MDTFDAIQQRRAVKHFDPGHVISESEKEKLLKHAILSPTSFNIQNWRFVVVEDPSVRKQIREAAWDQAQVTDASLLLILCADTKSWQSSERYWVNAPQQVQDIMAPATKKYYENKDQLQRDEAMRSCGIAAQTLMLSAKALGYDSCPMVGFDFEKVADIINLPENYIITMLVVVGKGVKDPWPRAGQLPLNEVVIHNKF